jgi:tetratricopeptide (TPR) repeat protein
MAEVYVAEDPTSGEEHALKIMAKGSPHADRFNQEYEALTRLNHPAIVRVYQYGVHQACPWFSMELIAGEPLQVWIKRVGKPGSEARTKEVMRSGAFVADAMGYIHERGLIHRDLKGNNVLMLPDGRVKLLDFGTAHIRDGLRQLTKPGEFIGTLAYASPEQFRGKLVDHRADLYALGVLLYRMITGHRPFSADDPAALARQIARSPPKNPSELVEGVPSGLDALIMQLLEKRPEDRPKSAALVAERLEELIGEPLGLPGWGAMARSDRMSGREDVVFNLRAMVSSPHAQVLVLGPLGSDRERVVDTVVGDARRDEEFALVARIAAPDQASPAVLDALLAAAGEVGVFEDKRVSAAVRALKLLRQRGRDASPRAREGLHQAATSVLIGIARARSPILFAIHDVHVADPLSLDLIAALAATSKRAEQPIRFLLSAEQADSATTRAIGQRLPDLTRVALAPLTVAQVALKVGAMLDRRPPPTALARAIHLASGGQPLWVEQVLARMVDQGAIRLIGEDGNRIEWEVTDDLPVPDGAADAVVRQILAQPELHRRVLQAVALCGPPAPIRLVARSLGWSSAEVLPILRDLAQAGWIHADGSEIHVTQPMFRRMALELVPVERHLVFQAEIADSVLDGPARAEHVDALLRTGRYDAAVQRALEAAATHMDGLETVDALAVLDRITGLAEEPSVLDPDLLARALLLHANCLLMVRPVDPGLPRSLSAAAALAGDGDTAVGVALARARLQRTLGHLVNHQKQLVAAQAEADQRGSPRMRGVVACFLAEAYRLSGRVRDAERQVERALAEAQTTGSQSLAFAHVAEAGLRVAQGRFTEAEPLIQSAIETFDREHNPRALWSALPTRVAILRLQGRYTQALDALYEQLPKARRCQEPSPTVRLLLAAAECEADLYRLGRAQEHIDEIETLIRKGEMLDVRLAASVVRGRILLASGHFRPAIVALEDTHERARSAGLPGISEVARALLAETLQAEDDSRQAKDMFASALLGLLGAGDAVSLIEGTLARLRAQGPVEPSSKILKPIADIHERHPLLVVEIERLLADARHHAKWKRKAESREAALDAQAALDRMAEALSDTDRAAIRLHPWSRHVRALLK